MEKIFPYFIASCWLGAVNARAADQPDFTEFKRRYSAVADFDSNGFS
jgi:hypothetical protein